MHTFVVTAYDAAGKPKHRGGDEFRVTVDCAVSTGETAPVTVTVRDLQDGTYVVTYAAHRAGLYTVAVQDATAQSLPGSPYLVRLSSGA